MLNNESKILRKSIASQFSDRQHRVFVARSKVYDQEAKDTLLRNRLQCFLFLVGMTGATGMNMSLENNMLYLLAKQVN